ncbi:ribonuclease H-like domain-containing protein [Tanacetum coccineum]
MKLAINTRNKTGFIDGTYVKATYVSSEPLDNQWERCNFIVLSWLLNSVSEDLFLGQIFFDNVAEVWAKLKETYDKLDGSIIFNLLQKIHNFKQEDVLKHNQVMKHMQFLMGLNDVYQPIRSSLLSTETHPDVKDAFAIISREESHRGIASSSGDVPKPQTSSFVSKTNFSNNNNNRNKMFDNMRVNNFRTNFVNTSGNIRGPNLNLTCKNYKNVSHIIEICFNIIGYPPRYDKSFSKPSVKSNFNANAELNQNTTQNGASLSFTNEQIMKLMSLVNDVPSGKIHANMAGANQHMTISTKNMFGIIDISYLNLNVGHPNGTLAKIKYVGNLQLCDNVVLYDVLVVPEYSVSLLYVHKLIRDSRMFVGFDKHKCYIKDLNQNKIMGTGSENGGRYLFDLPATQNKELQVSKQSHVSPCDICHKANQSREPFPLSDHKTLAVGDLVYIDLWGPYKVTSIEGFRYLHTIVDDYSRGVWVY